MPTVDNAFKPKNGLNLVNTADSATTATHYFVEIGSNGLIVPKTLANVRTEIVTASDVLTKIKTVDGAGSGLDADLLDNIESTRFIFGDNQSGSQNAAATQNLTDPEHYKSGFWDVSAASWMPNTSAWYWGVTLAHTSNSDSYLYGAQIAVENSNAAGMYVRTLQGGPSPNASTWTKVWNEANDGASSGLDADLLDGQQGSYYAPIASPTFTGTVTAATLDLTTAATATAATSYFVETGSDGVVRPKTLANVKAEVVTTAAVNAAAATVVGTITSGVWNAGAVTSSGGISGTTGSFSSTLSSGKLTLNRQDSVNEGGEIAFNRPLDNALGFTLDLYGGSASPQMRLFNSTATKLWYFNFDGATIFPGEVQVAGTADTATAATHYFVETGTDGYLRPKTLANVKTEILTNALIDNITATGASTAADLWSEVTTGSIAIGAGLTTGALNLAAAGTGATPITIGHTNATLAITSTGMTLTTGGTLTAAAGSFTGLTVRSAGNIILDGGDAQTVSAQSGVNSVLILNGRSSLSFTTGGTPGGGTQRMAISSAGNTSILAPATTAASLTWGAAAGQILRNENSELAIGLHNASPFNLYLQARTNTNTSRELVLNPLGGNVGIGLLDPTTALDVSGTVTATAFAGSGSALTALNGTNISSGTVAVARGGTGLGTTPTNGQILIGNGTNYTLATITAGTGISVTNGAGTISIAYTGTTVEQNAVTQPFFLAGM